MASNEKPKTRKQRRIERKRAKAMAGNQGSMPASLSDALVGDDSLPLDAAAKAGRVAGGATDSRWGPEVASAWSARAARSCRVHRTLKPGSPKMLAELRRA